MSDAITLTIDLSLEQNAQGFSAVAQVKTDGKTSFSELRGLPAATAKDAVFNLFRSEVGKGNLGRYLELSARVLLRAEAAKTKEATGGAGPKNPRKTTPSGAGK